MPKRGRLTGTDAELDALAQALPGPEQSWAEIGHARQRVLLDPDTGDALLSEPAREARAQLEVAEEVRT